LTFFFGIYFLEVGRKRRGSFGENVEGVEKKIFECEFNRI
jgi:hypothetical protein